MDILSAEHLTKVYGTGEQAVRALDNVSLSIAAGEFVAIIGSSGSGKSTLMHLLGGVDRPTEGSVYLNGEDIYARSDEQLAVFRRREVGLVYQFYNLIPVLDVEENMTLPVLLDGRKVNQRRLEMLVDSLGLRGREHHLPNQLSGGQQQRVALARSLTASPQIILADEPVASLDPVTARQVMDDFRRINQEMSITVLINIHHVDLALEYCDHVLGVRAGEVVYDGPSGQVTQDVLDAIYGKKEEA